MSTLPTPYPELNEVLREMVGSVEGALGRTFIGAYLEGSFAVGDFDEHSDVDFIVATTDELSDAQVDALQRVHGRVYDLDPEWAKHLEGSTSRSRSSGTPNAAERPFGTSITGAGHSLGRITATPSSCGACFASTVSRSPALRPRRSSTRLRWTSCPGSKRAGAEWAKRTFDPEWADLIDSAWDGRPNPAVSVRTPADPLAYARTLDFVRLMMSEAERVSAA